MRLRIWGLLYHHHLASGVVANLNHIGAADRCFETQFGELVLFGGKNYFASFTKICTFAVRLSKITQCIE